MIRHTHTHTQIPAPQVCVHIPPVRRTFPPAVTHVIPLSLKKEECEDEGIDGGGGVRVVSSYQHRGQLCKKRKPSLVVHRPLCSI